MRDVYTYKEASWIDLHKPAQAEIDDLVRERGIEPSVAESLLSPSSSHRVALEGRHAHIVLHFPAFKDAEDGDAAYELDLVIGDNFVLTARYGKVEALEKFKQSLQSGDLGPGSPRDAIFFGILSELIKNYSDKLSRVDHWSRDIEKGLFAGREKHTIFELSEASRHLIDFRKITSVWPEAFETLVEGGKKRFSPAFSEMAAAAYREFNKAQAKLALLTDAVRDLRETNDTILSVEQNELTRRLTIIALVTDIVVGAVLIYFSYLALH